MTLALLGCGASRADTPDADAAADVLGDVLEDASWRDAGPTIAPRPAAPTMEIGPPLTLEGIGAGQALDLRDGLLWVAGDAEVGVVRAFSLDLGADLAAGAATPTGELLRLTVAGADRVPHPTGLTHHPDVGTFLGNTVSGQGTLLTIDWDLLRGDGTLDRAVTAALADDLAVEGSRPELVRAGQRWLLATADYGERDNALRLLDPQQLRGAGSTSDPGVLVARLPAPPLVQSLRWIDAPGGQPGPGLLVLVQNTARGTGWKLTWIDLERSLDQGRLEVLEEMEPGLPGELEAMSLLDAEQGVLLTSGASDNLRFFRLRWP